MSVCETCNGKGRVRRHWVAGNERMSRTWMEDCPECGSFAKWLDEFNEIEEFKEDVKETELIFTALGELL